MNTGLFLWHLCSGFVRVHFNLFLPACLLRRLSEKRLIRTIEKAYAEVPFYRRKYDEAGIDIASIRGADDIKKLPFLTKDEVRNNFPDSIVARGTNLKNCQYSATTGSSGRPLKFLYSKATLAFYISTGLRMYTMIGYRPWHKIAYLKDSKMDYPRLGPFFRTVHIKSTISTAEQIARLRKARADLIIGYGSLIYDIARQVRTEDLADIRPKFIGTNSNVSTQEQRDYIAKVFGCPVYDEYSTEETWMIAAQCRQMGYHIFTDNVWVEFIGADGRDVQPDVLGEIILTTTRSSAMPFIRYRIGDMGRCSDTACPCGLGFPLMKSFDGRLNDCIIMPSGKSVSPVAVLYVFLSNITRNIHLLDEFKVTQLRKDFINIQIVKGKAFEPEQIDVILHDMRAILAEPCTIDLELVESIDYRGAIKRKAVESFVDRKDMAQVQ